MRTLKLLLICSLFSPLLLFSDSKAPEIPMSERDRYIESAQVWQPTNVSKMPIYQGPPSKIAVPPETTITCRYIEPKEPPTGATPKFKCTLPSGTMVRIKYSDREVFGEVAGSRLLWALGFYADLDYPVKIRCLRCPADPFHPDKNGRRATRIIAEAMMEENYPGVIIQQYEDQGWNYSDLSKVKEKSGGATPAQIDAFRLLGVFIQHSDNKPDNQRLGCYQEDIVRKNGKGDCRKPVLMIADLGSTFGSGTGFETDITKMDFASWKKTDIWNLSAEHDYLIQHKQQVCIGNLANTIRAKGQGLQDPQISEEGRKFLADLLNELTLNQIKDLFRAAGVDRMNQYIDDGKVRRKVTIEDWTAAFIKKRDQITERRCPTLAPKP